MTADCAAGNVIDMTKRTGTPIPREATTPSEYKRSLAARIKARREELGMSISDVAVQLSAILHRPIRGDTYRKWETIESIVQVDAILPLCDILRIHVFELLGYRQEMGEKVHPPAVRGKAVA